MKKLVLIFFLSIISYVLYITIIIAPLVRVSIITRYELLGEAIAAPGFLILLVLPSTVIYSLIMNKDYLRLNIIGNVFRHVLFFSIVYNSYLLYKGNIISKYINAGSGLIASMIGVSLFFVFHVFFMTYLLNKPWFLSFYNEEIAPSKSEQRL